MKDKILIVDDADLNREFLKEILSDDYEILDSMQIDWDEKSKKVIYEIIRHHHERFDGKGYPDGLKGEDIPVSAQLVSLADVYDALVSERCYKDAYSKDEAYHMIINGECGVFSPRLTEAFRAVKTEFEKFADDTVTDDTVKE